MSSRRPFFLAIAVMSVVSSPCAGGEVIAPSRATAETDGDTLWYDLRLLDVEGRGWTDTKAFYDRLPAKAEGVVREAVWNLSRHSAGLCARFATYATTIQARWTLTSAKLEMPHMVEDRSYTDAFLVAAKRQRNTDSRAALRAAYKRLTDAGTKHLAYLAGEDLLGDDGEGTVDSSHPIDLGFVRMALAYVLGWRRHSGAGTWNVTPTVCERSPHNPSARPAGGEGRS